MLTFLTACRAAGLSPRTTNWYEDILHALEETTHRPLLELHTTDLRTYLADLRARHSRVRPDRQISPATVRAHARAIKRFYNWCHQEDLLANNPAARLQLPKLPQATPRGATLTDIRRMLAIADVRDRAILMLLLDTGCRAAELCALHIQDIDLHAGAAQVIGKGSKERTVYLVRPTQCALAACQTFTLTR
jgi:site-specific recombinase XerD